MRSRLKSQPENSLPTYHVKFHRVPDESDFIFFGRRDISESSENREESELDGKSDYDSISRKRTRLRIPRGSPGRIRFRHAESPGRDGITKLSKCD